MVHLQDIKAFKGRNIHSHQKVVQMVVDLGSWRDTPTNRIEGFNERLLAHLPGLADHHCSIGIPGGFCQRLVEGTYLAHVIEHSALEIMTMLGYSVGFGRARQIGETARYTVVFAYKEERLGLAAGRLAIHLVNACLTQAILDFDTALLRLRENGFKHSLGPSTQAIMDAALERGIPVTRIGSGSLLQLGYGKYHQKIACTLSDKTSCISADIASDKSITKELLDQSGIPVPRGKICYSAEEAMDAVEQIGYPVVLKPVYGNQGKGVSIKLQTPKEVRQAFEIAREIHEAVLVEEYIQGRDYRILVVGDQIAAAALRIPAHVIGDGIHTLSQLITIKNDDEKRGEGHEKPLTRIQLDNITENLLFKQGYTIDSIPDDGVFVHLKSNGNISTGGEAVDCTEKIHPAVQEMAVRAARLVGLDIAGIDVTCQDIGKPLDRENGAVIEVNASPGIRMHLYPSKGVPRKVGNTIVDMLFPSGSPHSIPIVSVTGTNGKTTTTRMIAHILRAQGSSVGMTTTGGVYLNDKCLLKGDTTGPGSAQILLGDKAVEAAVLETARGGIIRSGLGYDLSDVGVLLNISEDHLGLDGVESLEDLLHVKALVIEAVKNNGYAVLNADDPLVVRAAGKTKANIIYFSRQENNLIIHKHICEGGIAVFLKNGYITVATGNGLLQSISIAQIPATHGGRLLYNMENTLAAIGAAYGLKIPMQVIEGALTTFYCDDRHNPGRFNLYTIRDYRVIVDYGHNIAGYQLVTEALPKFGASRLVGVVGVPGDRGDDTIRKIGAIAGHAFEKIYIKEDRDLRGRTEGETARLLMEGALKAGMPPSQIQYIRYETDALQKAMGEAAAGDLIVIFYENLEDIHQILNHALPQGQSELPDDRVSMLLKA